MVMAGKSREHGNLVPGKIPNIGRKVAKQKKIYICKRDKYIVL